MSAIIDLFVYGGLALKYGWPFIILAALVFAKVKWKNWPVDVVIIERRGNNLIKTNDRAGAYEDKFTGMKGYKLLKTKDTMPIVEYDWIVHNIQTHTNILEKLINLIRPTLGTLFLFKYGSKQYKPITAQLNGKAKIHLEEIKNVEGKTLYTQKYQQFDPRGSLEAVEFEVQDWDNMNFMVQEIRASFERRQKSGTWIKTILMPLAMIGGAIMVSIIMMKFSYDHSLTLSSACPSNIQPKAETPNIPLLNNVIPGQ